jgi:hypothetical protein
MVGMGMIESEPEINKVLWLQNNWRVMVAGDDISPAFPIVDAAKKRLARKRNLTVDRVMAEVYKSYCDERSAEAECCHLAPTGWTIKRFNSPASKIIPEAYREEISLKLQNHRLYVTLIVAGIDDRGKGHIFSISDGDHRARPSRHDIPGFYSIGSGAEAAMYMMSYREASLSMPLRLVLYYALEGKYFGERAGGVGTRTDVLVLRANKKPFKIKEKTLDDKLFDLCDKLKPRDLKGYHVDILNSLGGSYFSTIGKLLRTKEDGEWVIKGEGTEFSKQA